MCLYPSPRFRHKGLLTIELYTKTVVRIIVSGKDMLQHIHVISIPDVDKNLPKEGLVFHWQPYKRYIYIDGKVVNTVLIS